MNQLIEGLALNDGRATTCGQIRDNYSLAQLRCAVGVEMAQRCFDVVRGLDSAPVVNSDSKPKAISCDSFANCLRAPPHIVVFLGALIEMMVDRLLIDRQQFERVATKLCVAARISQPFDQSASSSVSKTIELASYVAIGDEPLGDEQLLRRVLASPHLYSVAALPSQSSSNARATFAQSLFKRALSTLSTLIPRWPVNNDACAADSAVLLDVGVRSLGVSCTHFVDLQGPSIASMFATVANNSTTSTQSTTTMRAAAADNDDDDIDRSKHGKRSLPRLIVDELVCNTCAARFADDTALAVHRDYHVASELSKQINAVPTTAPLANNNSSSKKRRRDKNTTLFQFFSQSK
jgi:hypothetical protein